MRGGMARKGRSLAQRPAVFDAVRHRRFDLADNVLERVVRGMRYRDERVQGL
jgi:hypothetical protein